MQIEVIAGDEISAEDRAAVVAMTSAAFECDYDVFLRSFGRMTHVIARADGRIVSHALWCDRGLQPEGMRVLKSAYVEAVATLPEYQGRGYASAIMRRLVEAISDYEIAALGPSDPAFYERLGWELWKGELFARRDGKLETVEDHEVMILRLPKSPELDVSRAMSVEWRELEVW